MGKSLRNKAGNKIALLVLLASGLIVSGCTHSIEMNSAHFITPMTNDNQWGGMVALSGAKPTTVMLVEGIGSNPPVRNGVKINDDINSTELILLEYLDVDLKLSVYPSVEVTVDSEVVGVKWQFLNHRQSDTVLASLLVGYGSRSKESSTGTAKAKTELQTTRTGVSVGYGFAEWAPYASFVYDQHKTKTEVNNNSGKFNYDDKGTHQNISIGVSTRGQALAAALEFNHVMLDWDGAKKTSQDGIGIQLGYQW